MIEINLFIQQTHRFRERTYGCQGEKVGGKEEQGSMWRVKRYKLLGIKQATRIYHIIWVIQPIFYKTSKESIIYKSIKSLCCTPETNIVNQLYFN